jgi:uncharacterized protein
MGLAGTPHCVAMCGVASAAAVRACGPGPERSRWLFFHLGRLAGYAVAGGVAASAVGTLSLLGTWSPALRPLWTMAHLAALALGLALLWLGRQPHWLESIGRRGSRGVQTQQASGWQVLHGPAKAAALGSIWFAWPCGLLQSALMVAALANGALGGALVMAGFALASAVSLGAAPVLWRRWLATDQPGVQRLGAWIVRLSGAALAAASLWALAHDLIERFAMWCAS